MTDDGLIVTGKVRIIADEPVKVAKKLPWWRRLLRSVFG